MGRCEMEDYIKITQLNDFIFCPVSIYFHNLYEDSEPMLYQGSNSCKVTRFGYAKNDEKDFIVL